jgi:hypothetical protein
MVSGCPFGRDRDHDRGTRRREKLTRLHWLHRKQLNQFRQSQFHCPT